MKYTGVVKNQLGLMIIVNKSIFSRRIGSLNFLKNKKKSLYCSFLYGIKPQPESLNEPLHLLCFTLDADVVLKFPQGFVELHALEVHFVYHTAGTWGEGWREKRQIHQNTDCHSFCAHPHSLVAQQGWFGPDSIMEDMSVNSCHIGAISHSHRLWDLRWVNPLSNCLTVFICSTLLFKKNKTKYALDYVAVSNNNIFLIIPVAILTPRHLCWTASVDCQEILQSSACLAPFSAAGSEPLRLACQGWILSQ